MKKLFRYGTLALCAVCCMVFFTACFLIDKDIDLPTDQPTQLARAETISYNDETKIVSWSSVANAIGYLLSVTGAIETPITSQTVYATSYTLTGTQNGTVTVFLISIGDGDMHLNSEAQIGNFTATSSYVNVNYDNFDYFSKNFDPSLTTFYDKFEGNSLDMSKWIHQEGTGWEYGIWGWGNSEKQSYHRENVRVQDGILRLEAKKERRADDAHFEYTSAKLVTFDTRYNTHTFSQKYGRFEARIRMTKAVQGMWPAFWMMPRNSVYGGWPRSGEIDIMEMMGRFPNRASSALHFYEWGGHYYEHNEYTLPNGGNITQWHIYGVEWTPERITFLINGVPHLTLPNYMYGTTPANSNQTVTASSPFDQEFYLILNLAVGGMFDGHRLPPDGELPVELQIDWVRAYELNNLPAWNNV
ncbi:MAG: glycoside hydrolase family 16 protein [Firmicutes bacterium]|nr:glycoside hydrolase family 16 protein [Bacillota bacterium]